MYEDCFTLAESRAQLLAATRQQLNTNQSGSLQWMLQMNAIYSHAKILENEWGMGTTDVLSILAFKESQVLPQSEKRRVGG